VESLQKIFNIPIHYSVFSLFYNDPDFIFLKDVLDNHIPIPYTIYCFNCLTKIYSNYNKKEKCFFIQNESKVLDIHQNRYILFIDKFSKIENDIFKYKNINDLQIISE